MGRLQYGCSDRHSGHVSARSNVEGRLSCGTTGGWYYDDNTAPTRLALCPATCDPLVTAAGSVVTLLVGCASVGRPPP